jgi:protein required for attachment to host cells
VVCDGSKALFFRNDGNAERLNLTMLDVLAQADPPTRELGTDRPGRVHQSYGTARSAVETTDFHAEAEMAFLAMVAEQIDKAAREKLVNHVILVAPPKALGHLRKLLTDAARALVTAEIGKDLARLSTQEIEKHLAA